MDYKEELVERFGKQLMEEVRDKQIHLIDAFLEKSQRYKGEISALSPAQVEMIKEIAVQWVDGTLHDFLYMLEDSNWIKLRLEGESGVLEDIRQATDGDIQAYIFIWAEKYSTKRLTDYTKPY